jgi:hypothetical protein
MGRMSRAGMFIFTNKTLPELQGGMMERAGILFAKKTTSFPLSRLPMEVIYNGQHHHLVAYYRNEGEAGLRLSEDLSLMDSVGQLILPISLFADAFIIAMIRVLAMGQKEKPTSSNQAMATATF